jgi:MFS family permease
MLGRFTHHFQALSPNFRLFLLGHGIQAFGHAVYALLFNLFLREAGMKEGVMGSLASTTSMGIALMAFPAAFILERFAVKPMLIAGMCLSATFYLLQTQSNSVEMFTFFGLLGSMGLALFSISIPPFIYRNTPPAQRVFAFTLNSATSMGAQLVGFMVGGVFPEILLGLGATTLPLEAFRWSMGAALAVTFTAGIPYSRIVRVPVPKLKRSFFGELREKDWKTIGGLLAPKACIAVGAGMIIPFMNVYLSKKFTLGSAAIGVCFGVLQLFMFVGIFLSPLVVRRMDRLRFILVTAFLSVPFMLTMAFASSVSIVLGSFFLRGMLMNMSGPVTSLFEMERVREKECLFASSMLIFCYNTAWTFSTQIGGWIIETHGFRTSFIVASVFYLAAVVCYWRFFRDPKTLELPDSLPATQTEAA